MFVGLVYILLDFFVMLQVVEILADAGQSTKLINCADEEGWAPIHSAASIGRSDILDILVSRGSEF